MIACRPNADVIAPAVHASVLRLIQPFLTAETDTQAIGRAMIQITLALCAGQAAAEAAAETRRDFGALEAVLARHERAQIIGALDACGGSVTRARVLLGLNSRQTLYKKMHRLGIPPPPLARNL